MGKYDDIIMMEHHSSKGHARMSMLDRAAQFAPFAALTGYDDVIFETGRMTGSKLELDEMQTAALNETMALMEERIHEKPAVRIVRFIPDSRKEGGEYATLEGRVRNIDYALRILVMADDTKIPFGDIFSITLD